MLAAAAQAPPRTEDVKVGSLEKENQAVETRKTKHINFHEVLVNLGKGPPKLTGEPEFGAGAPAGAQPCCKRPLSTNSAWTSSRLFDFRMAICELV